MGILDFLLGRQEDLTKDWPVRDFVMPDFDLASMTFGPLHFGCELACAQFFGRPDLFTWKGKDYCKLLFARAGFQIDFEDGHLCYIAFFIGPDEFLPEHQALVFSQPNLAQGRRFNRQTSTADLKKFLGEVESEDIDSDEIIITFLRSGITLEFELTTDGFLKRWNLFPEQG
ncbi:MAG: hypothetical protein ACD_39C01795G0002 [uncultured bacterium]|nr:MAG: hypothetical protein ACD_39C01795G0002 [uncultured bacterium]